MAFPGKYDISYYKGDTFEFRIYPKDSSGNAFQFDTFTQFRFTMSNVLGDTAPVGVTKVEIDGFARNYNNQYILCAITPDNGAEMVAGQTYYYDVEIGRIASPYDQIYTLLHGTVSVSEQVTPPTALPNAPQNVSIVFSSATTANIAWSAPTGTAPVGSYNVYLVTSPTTTVPLNTEPISSSTTNFTFTIPPTYQPFFPPGTPVVVGVRAENTSGEGAIATVASIIPVGS